MITSHRDRRAFQNYDYNSRSSPIFYRKSQILARPCVRPSSTLPNRFGGSGRGDGFPASREEAPTSRPGPCASQSPLRRLGRDQMRE